MQKKHSNTRRNFLKKSTFGIGSLALGSSTLAFGNLTACAENNDKKLGIALVGLGNYSTGQLAPALLETQFCKLSGIVTGTPSKAEKWKKQYNIPEANIYNYETFDRIADNPEIDIIYIVLPNAMHAEFTIRAAQAGKHIICEKPMATSSKDAEAMIAACKKAGVLLQIGYRLQYESYNQKIMELGQKEKLGKVHFMEISNGFYAIGYKNWRFDKALSGGGPLQDMGIYCLQAAQYCIGKSPIAVTAQQAKTRPDFFKEVEETLYFQLEFEGGVTANCMTTYAGTISSFRGHAEQGNFELNPAFFYGPLDGNVNGNPMNLPFTNQQAVQIDAFARNILDETEIIASGEMGLRDVRIIEGIYEAMETGERVLL